MRSLAAVGIAALLSGNALAATAASPFPFTHTRPLSEEARRLAIEASRRSALVRGLMERLERSDVVVYLALSMSGFGQDHHGHLTFTACAAGIRYVLVKIDSWSMAPDEQIALLGHELHHATEVADAVEVRDQESFKRLYERIGRKSRCGGFETNGAREMGYLVRNELIAPGQSELAA